SSFSSLVDGNKQDNQRAQYQGFHGPSIRSRRARRIGCSPRHFWIFSRLLHASDFFTLFSFFTLPPVVFLRKTHGHDRCCLHLVRVINTNGFRTSCAVP